MAKIERVNVWYDKAGHYLDVHWVSGRCFTPTENDDVWVLVDQDGGISGFKVWGVDKIKDGEIVNAELTPVELPQTAPEPAAAT